MNTSSAVATTTSHTSYLPFPEWSHSRSQTEPLIESPERSHEPRLSVDGSPRHPALEHNHSNATPSHSRPQNKRRSTTLTSLPTRKSHSTKGPGLPKSPSVPTFHTKPDPRDSKPALPSTTPESLPATPAPLLRVPSNASTTDSRSPSQRRSPASHSSYGVETSNGPPPSFTTQRTLSQDRLWKPPPPEKSNVAKKVNAGYFHEEFGSQSIDMDDVVKDQEVDPGQDELDTPITPRKRPDESASVQDVDLRHGTAGRSTETLCKSREQLAQELDVPSADDGSRNSGSEDRKSEDVFLNIAQTDAGGQELMTRAERRKVRILQSPHSCRGLFPTGFLTNLEYLVVKNWSVALFFSQQVEPQSPKRRDTTTGRLSCQRQHTFSFY